MSATYSVRYVHKISPKASDVHADVELSGNAFADRKALGAALRKAGVLSSGVQVESFRVEGEKTVVFPRGCIWHSVILTHQEPAAPAKPGLISAEQLASEIVSAIETYRDIEGAEPTAQDVLDSLCDDARKAGFRFDEAAARELIAKKLR